MGLSANYVREPKDTDIIGAYYRLLRVENHYRIIDEVTVPSSTIIADIYRDKGTRDIDTTNVIAHHGFDVAGVITNTLDAYNKLAVDLGVENIEV